LKVHIRSVHHKQSDGNFATISPTPIRRKQPVSTVVQEPENDDSDSDSDISEQESKNPVHIPEALSAK
jgi:hypothetical protein